MTFFTGYVQWRFAVLVFYVNCRTLLYKLLSNVAELVVTRIVKRRLVA